MVVLEDCVERGVLLFRYRGFVSQELQPDKKEIQVAGSAEF